jgi:hypothetical protein
MAKAEDETTLNPSREEPKRDFRDKELWDLLPPRDAPYDYRRLSEAETNALTEALCDGFGGVLERDGRPATLPRKVESGLLNHPFYLQPCSPFSGEYDAGDWDDAFWSSANGDDAPCPYERFPLGFLRRRLRVYFHNQFERFCHLEKRELEEFWEQQTRDDPTLPPTIFSEEDKWIFEHKAHKRLYEKPWYEVHALQFLDWIESDELTKHPGVAFICNVGFAGQLGRLIEQYYWRLRFEGATLTGVGARKGASAGGKAKSELHQAEHAAWQRAASNVWARRPELSKLAVAKVVRTQLGAKRTDKHIARYIIRP